MPGPPGHLFRRFLDVLASKPLSDAEMDEVSGWLSEPEQELFRSQPVPDQRHGYESGRFVADAGWSGETISAATLHDIGKRHAKLGIIGRSVASVLLLLRLDGLWGRARAYRDHGAIAAEELSRVGSAPLVSNFARHHHRDRPADIDQRVWDLLRAADEPQKRRYRPDRR